MADAVKREKGIGWDALNLRIKALSHVEARVGWFPDAQYANGTYVAYAMAVQEFGYSGGRTFKIPPRPFFRPTIAREKNNWTLLAADLARKALTPGSNVTARNMMELLAARAQGDVLKTISSIVSPPLSKVTLELRSMKKRNPLLNVTRATVFEAIRRVKAPGYTTPSVNNKPLEDTGKAVSTLDILVQNV